MLATPGSFIRNDNVKEQWSDIPITVHHYPDGWKSRGGYLPLLAEGAATHPDNDRLAHYYGDGRWVGYPPLATRFPPCCFAA